MSATQFEVTEISSIIERIEVEQPAISFKQLVDFEFPKKFEFRFPVVFYKENDSWCAEVPLLPGACSFGDSIEEAMTNIREAALGCLEDYIHRNQPIPWEPLENIVLPVEDSETEFVKWVSLHVPAVA